VERFLVARREAGYSSWCSARSVALPVEYLQELGVVPSPPAVVADGPGALAERSNRENLVIAQIESTAGIENADAIASVPGVDVVWLGQFDLSLSLGVPGRFEDATYLAAVDRLIEICRHHHRPLGQMIGTPAEGAALRERGFQVLAYADVLVFERALREQMDALRGG